MSSTIPYTDNLQQTAEPSFSADPFATEPEIYGEETFVFDNSLNVLSLADRLVSEAKTLLNILQTTQPWSIREKFQIELRKVDIHDDRCSEYKMSLRIEPSLWFKHHALNNNDVESLEQLYDFGCGYYKKVKSETESSFEIKSENEIRRLEFNTPPLTERCYQDQKGKICDARTNLHRPCLREHYPWCSGENTHITGKCTTPTSDVHNRYYCHLSDLKVNNKVIYQCRYESLNLKGRKVRCLFHADPNTRIYTDEVTKPSDYPYFVVSARPDATPVITLCPIKHCENEKYVQTSDAWQAVLQTLIYMKDQLKLDKLPLNRIFVNFGKWMSQKAEDPMRRQLHAHINIVLTRETIERIDDRNQSKDKNTWLFPSLVGSVLPQICYRSEDAWKLMEYMNGYMIPNWNERNRELKRKISILEDELKLVKQEHERLKQSIYIRPYNGQEIEEPANITDEVDIGKGINDAIVMQEYQSYYSSKWDRFLFPWNR